MKVKGICFRLLYLCILVPAIANLGLEASTIAIATGTATRDGRPLLLKNKDRTDNYPSDLNYYVGTDSEYSYVYQQNDGDNHEDVRMGINTVGFAIVYTTSENLEDADSGPTGSELAAIALKHCSSISDFRDMLDSSNGKRRVTEHYAVIDSSGKGALYEVDGYSYVEIPVIDSIASMANTSKYHPSAGPPAAGSTSPAREARAVFLMRQALNEGLTAEYMVNEVMKDFCRNQDDEDAMPMGQYTTNAVLSRYKTAAAAVIRGVLSEDNLSAESVMWLSLSEPSLSVALPLPANCRGIPDAVRANAPGDGMAGSSDLVRMNIYDYSNGRYGDRSADTDILMDIQGKIKVIQDSLFSSYDRLMDTIQTMNGESETAFMQEWLTDIVIWAKAGYDSAFVNDISSIPPVSAAQQLRIFQNYPNPFNSSTTFSYSLPGSSRLRISVYNLRGEKISGRDCGFRSAGRHLYTYKLSNNKGIVNPAGMYIYSISSEFGCKSGKMIYLP